MHGTTNLKVVLTVQFNSIFRAATTRKGRKPLQYILQRAIIVIVVLILYYQRVSASLLHKAVIRTAHIALFLISYQTVVFSMLITGIIIRQSQQLLCEEISVAVY